MLGMEEAPEQDRTVFYRTPISRNVEEAVQILMDELSLKDKVAIANNNADEVSAVILGRLALELEKTHKLIWYRR